MASVMRREEFARPAGSDVSDRRSAREPVSLAAFRGQVDLSDAQSLSALIESEIIPRLMVSHATAGALATGPAEGALTIDALEIEAFAPLVMQMEADELLVHVEAILARGVSFDAVLVDMLAPTARMLGEFWEDDRCDFVDVTMGLWRLQEVVHEISDRQPVSEARGTGSRRALFATMPGDQHGFGTVVIDEMFRCDGWVTDRLCGTETPDLLKRIADDWFDLIGLTVSCDLHMAALPSMIAALRNVSRNSRLCVMVGGRVFSEDPELAAHVGADGTARDAKLALEVADRLVRERASGASTP